MSNEGSDGRRSDGASGGADAGGSGTDPADAGIDRDGPDVAALRMAREEAQRTLDGQLSTLDDVDAKALSVFRLNVAVVGALLSALSFAGASDTATAAALLTPLTGAGVTLFVLSAAAAGLAYTVAGQQVGVAPSGLERARNRSERAFLASLVAGYGEWIRYNERTNARKAPLVTLSVLGTVAGALAVGVGVLGAFVDAGPWPAVAAFALVAALALLTGLPGQLRRLFGDGGESAGTVAPQTADSPLSGQRTFSGRDREE